MLGYFVRQSLSLLLTLLLVVIGVFLAMRALPGDPATLLGGIDATEETLQDLRKALRIDQPPAVQLVAYLGDLLQGNLGYSMRQNRPVGEIVMERVTITLWLALMAFGMSLAIGLILGITAGLGRGSPADRFTLAYGVLGLALPEFWIGLALILIFAIGLGWFPLLGFPDGERLGAQLYALILPALALAIPRSAQIARLTRAQIREELSLDYRRTAVAKGLWGSPLNRHVLANALPAVVPLVLLELGGLLTGSIIIEQVFGIPGLGQALLGAISARDYAVVQGVAILAVVVFAVASLFSDLLQALADPRVRYT